MILKIGMRDRMIHISGMNFQQSSMWPSGSMERVIVQQMHEHPVVYSYQSLDELSFELKLRKNIIVSARAMNQGYAQFEPFSRSRCNPEYWYLTNVGGFQLKHGVMPSDAIQDIYTNSSLYAFECATAKMIIYYHAVLNTMGESLFNQVFQDIYLYSWHADPELGIQPINTNYFLPGDVVYFNNPEFHPETPWWRGENAVVLEDGAYFAHGVGIGTAEHIIQELNKARMPGSTQSAYLTTSVVRPSFKHLAKISMLSRNYMAHRIQHAVIHHNESSISGEWYRFYFYYK